MNTTSNPVIGWVDLEARKKIGVLGGTFDPPHLGHLKLATHFSRLFHLDELLLIPSGTPWQKGSNITPAEIRLQLTEAAAIDLARAFLYLKIPTQIGVDRIEIDRSGPSYAIDTVKSLRESYGNNVSLIWLMGADSLIQLPTWNSWEELLKQVHFAVASRPGYTLLTKIGSEVQNLLTQHRTIDPKAIENSANGRIYLDESLSIDLSSTDLRKHLHHPSAEPIDTARIPSHVSEIITNLGLYK